MGDPTNNNFIERLSIPVVSATSNNRNEAKMYHIKTHKHESGNPLKLMFIRVYLQTNLFYVQSIDNAFAKLTLNNGGIMAEDEKDMLTNDESDIVSTQPEQQVIDRQSFTDDILSKSVSTYVADLGYKKQSEIYNLKHGKSFI